MNFKYRADELFDQFRLSIVKNVPVKIQAQGIQGAKLVSYPSPPLFLKPDGEGSKPIITKLSLIDATSTIKEKEVATLNRAELKNFFEFVEKNTNSDYRLVKTNSSLWRAVYGVRKKGFDRFDSKANKMSVLECEATYCQKCGVVLPLRNLTIDHQKPQKGGGMEAMLRVFRAAGLTVSTGSGQKNRYLQSMVAKTVGGNTTILQRGERGNDRDRYTLNFKGIVYFTVLQHYNLTDQMQQMSMHHIVNLRPMCGPCNSGLQNSNITFSNPVSV